MHTETKPGANPRRDTFNTAAMRMDDAARALRGAVKTLEGIEFAGEIEEMKRDAERIAQRLREYALNGW